MKLRLNQALARLGVVNSRRKADELIRAGRVAVNGKLANDFSLRVDIATDRIAIDGKLIFSPRRTGKEIYLAFNKPKGVISTWSDERGRVCLADFFEEKKALIAVGRLDRRSEGLMIITTDGELANRLMHPRYQVPRKYEVLVAPPIADEVLAYILEGFNVAPRLSKHYVISPDRETPVRKEQAIFLFQPKDARILQKRKDATLLELTMARGRYREIRRAMEALNLTVLRLKRTAYGPITLGSLKPGQVRPLAKRQIKALKELTGIRE